MMNSQVLVQLDKKASSRNSGNNQNSRQKMRVENLSAGFGQKKVLDGISISFNENAVTAIIGPSGCGKSTLVRCLNRMHEVTPGAWVSGHVFLDDEDIFSPSTDPVAIRRKIGMVFQKPNPFPTMSIFDNVAAGLKLNGVRDRKVISSRVEENLKKAFLELASLADSSKGFVSHVRSRWNPKSFSWMNHAQHWTRVRQPRLSN
jgi:phosphate transport system ATP-binding protein